MFESFLHYCCETCLNLVNSALRVLRAWLVSCGLLGSFAPLEPEEMADKFTFIWMSTFCFLKLTWVFRSARH